MLRFCIGFTVLCLLGIVALNFLTQVVMVIMFILWTICLFLISSLIGEAVVWAYSSLLKKLRK